MYYVVCELQEGIIDELKTELNRLTLKLMCSLLKQHFPTPMGDVRARLQVLQRIAL